jgi:hypothetical protein
MSMSPGLSPFSTKRSDRDPGREESREEILAYFYLAQTSHLFNHINQRNFADCDRDDVYPASSISSPWLEPFAYDDDTATDDDVDRPSSGANNPQA